MKAYCIKYKMNQFGEEKAICVVSNTKADAYDIAVYENIPQKDGSVPYSAWVESVTYKNGNCKKFNTHEGRLY